MNTTPTTGPVAPTLTGCPWPSGIHRFVLGACTRCGQEDPNPPHGIRRLPDGFTEDLADSDAPVPYVPTVLTFLCQEDGCWGTHEGTYSHEGHFGEGPIYAVVCPRDDVTDYYTLEGQA